MIATRQPRCSSRWINRQVSSPPARDGARVWSGGTRRTRVTWPSTIEPTSCVGDRVEIVTIERGVGAAPRRQRAETERRRRGQRAQHRGEELVGRGRGVERQHVDLVVFGRLQRRQLAGDKIGSGEVVTPFGQAGPSIRFVDLEPDETDLSDEAERVAVRPGERGTGHDHR